MTPTNDNFPERLWNHEDVKQFLGLKSDYSLHKMRSTKKIPYLKIPGTGIRYNPASVKQWAINQEAKVHRVWR